MDLKDGKGQRIHVDDPRFDRLFEACATYKIPVLIHTAELAMFFQPRYVLPLRSPIGLAYRLTALQSAATALTALLAVTSFSGSHW